MTIKHLPSGRVILDTGKVQIGIRAGESAAPRSVDWDAQFNTSADADLIQKALLKKEQPVKYDVTSAGHRCVFIVSLVGRVGFVVWALLGALS